MRRCQAAANDRNRLIAERFSRDVRAALSVNGAELRRRAHEVIDRVISGIVHVLKTGCRWQDCPSVYAPPTTIYNRFRRWTMRGLWRRLFEALARAEAGEGQAIDSTTAKAHRSAAGGKGGLRG